MTLRVIRNTLVIALLLCIAGSLTACIIDGDSSLPSGCKLPVPTGLRASDGLYSDRVVVSWNSVSGATWYNVYRATSPSGTYTNLVTTGSTSWTDWNVTPGKTYYYKVSCNNSATSNACLSDQSDYNTGYAG
jgi:hypothetical protein